MNPTTSVVGALGLTTVGRWSEDKPLDIKVVVGGAGFVIGLSLIGQANEDLANKLALCALIFALFRYVPSIGKKSGLIKGG